MNYNFEKAVENFKLYTKNFDFSNNMINKKFHHTFRVVDYAKDIAKSLNLNEHDFYIASVCALLHDIGRFQQAIMYNTFNDLKSVDHGDLGYEILLNDDYISNYVTDEEDKLIVLKAVKNHNKYMIEDGLTEKELFFTKLTRDADKLDIFQEYSNSINDNSNTIDDYPLQMIREQKLCKRDGNTKPDATYIAYQLTFVFDLNFKRSFEILIDKNIIKRKLDVLQEHCDPLLISEIRIIFNNYIQKALTTL